MEIVIVGILSFVVGAFIGAYIIEEYVFLPKYNRVVGERDKYYNDLCTTVKDYCDTLFDDIVELKTQIIKNEDISSRLEVCFLDKDVDVAMGGVDWVSEIILPVVEDKVYKACVGELIRKLKLLDVAVNYPLEELDPSKRFVVIVEHDAQYGDDEE